MKTILITGGANGLGKGVALHYLSKGNRVIAVSNSAASGESFLNEAKQYEAEERAVFIKADLSLINENKRIIEKISEIFPTLDLLIFCASKHRKNYSETAEGLESSFALDYLSRFLLSYGLKECLEKTAMAVLFSETKLGGNFELRSFELRA